MSDQALLIGSQPAEPAPQASGRSNIAVPTDICDVSVFGVFPDDTAIEQKFTVNRPRNVPDDQIALFLWDNVSKLGGLTVAGAKGEYNFYPVAQFKRLTLKLGEIVIPRGVNL